MLRERMVPSQQLINPNRMLQGFEVNSGALIKFLESREAAAVYKAKGMYPN
jgi:hypothetical protein